MGIFSKSQPKDIDRRESLAGIAVVNEGVEILEGDDDETVTVKIQVPRSPHFLDRFRPPIIEKKYELDELGAFLLRAIDGKKSAGDLVDEFTGHYRLNRRESELSVVSFLKMLMQRRVISMVIADQAKGKSRRASGRSRKR